MSSPRTQAKPLDAGEFHRRVVELQEIMDAATYGPNHNDPDLAVADIPGEFRTVLGAATELHEAIESVLWVAEEKAAKLQTLAIAGCKGGDAAAGTGALDAVEFNQLLVLATAMIAAARTDDGGFRVAVGGAAAVVYTGSPDAAETLEDLEEALQVSSDIIGYAHSELADLGGAGVATDERRAEPGRAPGAELDALAFNRVMVRLDGMFTAARRGGTVLARIGDHAPSAVEVGEGECSEVGSGLAMVRWTSEDVLGRSYTARAERDLGIPESSKAGSADTAPAADGSSVGTHAAAAA